VGIAPAIGFGRIVVAAIKIHFVTLGDLDGVAPRLFNASIGALYYPRFGSSGMRGRIRLLRVIFFAARGEKQQQAAAVAEPHGRAAVHFKE
jgi:hypothetical protein